jgi:hypothetical protein
VAASLNAAERFFRGPNSMSRGLVYVFFILFFVPEAGCCALIPPQDSTGIERVCQTTFV